MPMLVQRTYFFGFLGATGFLVALGAFAGAFVAFGAFVAGFLVAMIRVS